MTEADRRAEIIVWAAAVVYQSGSLDQACSTPKNTYRALIALAISL